MHVYRIQTLAIAIIGCIALSACNSNSTPSPGASPANVSGDYSGTIQDSQNGSGTVTGTLAQHGHSAGGAMTVSNSNGTIAAQLSISVASDNSFTGAMVIDFPPQDTGPVCTFKTTGTYSSSGASPTLAGSYTAVTNCSGVSGTFSLTQECTDTVTSIERRPMAFPAHC